jgi:hypothetical protein
MAKSGPKMPTTPNNRRTYIRRTELFKVVPAPELLSVIVAVGDKIGMLEPFRKGIRHWFQRRIPAANTAPWHHSVAGEL